jgi:hypothetical protein
VLTLPAPRRSSLRSFHCFRHAFMVTHCAWRFLAADGACGVSTGSVRSLLKSLDCLALLLAAICHDLEHPGTTNAFQVNSGSALALRYNDSSVLESHHAASGCAAMARTRLLSRLSQEDAKALRRTFVAAVLATDMSVHKALLARVAARVGESADAAAAERAAGGGGSGGGGGNAADAVAVPHPNGGGFAARTADDRQLLVCFLLHNADLCNPLLPPPLSRRLATDLGREFNAQADAERAAGLPVTVMLAADDGARAKLEVGFIEFCVRPLYVTLAALAPKLGARCLTRIDANRAAWAALIVE